MEEYIKLQADLIQLYKEYIKLLGAEINSLITFAYVHEWESTNIEAGHELRKKIAEINKQLKQLNGSTT